MTRPTSDPAASLKAWLRAMPKAELHVHLDGSLRPGTALDLARHRDVGIDAATMTIEEMRRRLVAPERCLDQAELLQAFDLPVALLQDAEALARCTTELIEDIVADGTRYVEIRWAPSLHTEGGLSLREGIAAVVTAAGRAAHDSGIEVRLIAVALRTHTSALAIEVAHASLAFLADGLTGFDLAGREREAPDARVFAGAFAVARAGGLGITCHAGEWGGPAQVRAAMAIEPWRIAHGAPAADDAILMAELRARGITLDICPTSNRQAGVGRDAEVPALRRLLQAGVPVTINTDDRTVSDLDLNEELYRAVVRLGISTADIVTLQRQAYAAAFLHHDEVVRATLLQHFDGWLQHHPPPQSGAIPG